MHYMSKTIVCLYAALYVQNFRLYALHVQAKLGVDEAIKPGIGPPRGRLQGKIEDFCLAFLSDKERCKHQ